MEVLIEVLQLLVLVFIASRVSGGGAPNPPPGYSTESIYDVLGETDVENTGAK